MFQEYAKESIRLCLVCSLYVLRRRASGAATVGCQTLHLIVLANIVTPQFEKHEQCCAALRKFWKISKHVALLQYLIVSFPPSSKLIAIYTVQLLLLPAQNYGSCPHLDLDQSISLPILFPLD
jgi:hypothetical protein